MNANSYSFMTSQNPTDASAIAAQLAAFQQALDKRLNCGVLKNGKQYYLQSVNGSFKDGYVQASIRAVDSERGATLTRQLERASKFTAVQKSCNVYGLCVRGLCMSRCEGCKTGTNEYQTVAFHVNDTTGSYSQWTLSPIGGVAGGPYNLKSDIEQYLDYVRLQSGAAIVSLNATLLPESQFKFIEVEPCVGMLEDGREYYLKTGNGDYVVVRGLLAYLEQIEQANATKFRAVQWDCNVYGFCITGTGQCMSRCENCVSDTMNYQSVKFHVNDSFRPYSQWTFLINSESGLITLYAEGQFGNVYFNTTPSGAKQLVLDLNDSLEFEFIKVTQI